MDGHADRPGSRGHVVIIEVKPETSRQPSASERSRAPPPHPVRPLPGQQAHGGQRVSRARWASRSPGCRSGAERGGALPGERHPAPRGPPVPGDPQRAVGGQRYALLVGFEPDE